MHVAHFGETAENLSMRDVLKHPSYKQQRHNKIRVFKKHAVKHPQSSQIK